MTKKIIRLPAGEWEYDDAAPLGEAGGFGEVFRGQGQCGDVAVKRLKLSAAQAAHRELNIGRQLMERELSHVVPVLDAGQDADSEQYFLVMPVCDRSLQDEIDQAGGGVKFSIFNEAVEAIISGLLEVDDITHRDLKPSNVLLHQGVWKIADFGIAKFVEDSTSLETLRDCLTPTYAAPEQWLGERPSSSTDVYSLGCIIHALINGQPPFFGTIDDIREKHLHVAPDLIDTLNPRIAAFVSHMLRKPPASRPTLQRCSQVLSEMSLEPTSASGARKAISEAAKRVAEREAHEEAEQRAADTRRRDRDALFEDAKREMIAIRDRLFGELKDVSESVKINHRGELEFGHAVLGLQRDPEKIEDSVAASHAHGGKAYERSGWDVLGWTIIRLSSQYSQTNRPYFRSASLLFADLHNDGGYRWYEIAFWSLAESQQDEPFGLEGYMGDIDLAVGNIMHTVAVAYGPYSIDGEDEESFIDRWISLVAKAAEGQLKQPASFPIRDFDN